MNVLSARDNKICPVQAVRLTAGLRNGRRGVVTRTATRVQNKAEAGIVKLKTRRSSTLNQTIEDTIETIEITIIKRIEKAQTQNLTTS
jgi:hypothetical protein